MFSGDRLRVARQRRAMTKKNLATHLNITPRSITGWEADEYPPEPERLEELAKVLGFPISFFCLEESAKTKSDAVSFRSLSTKTAKQRDAVIAMCDLAQDVAEWIDQHFDMPTPSIPDLRGEKPSVAATLLRREWGLGIRPIKNMLHLLEAKGVKVFALAENCREIDACSFWSNRVPFVTLNTNVSNERLRFDMAHELGHLVLHKHAAPSGRQAENEANQFASEFLMPEESVRGNRARNWNMRTLIEKKKIWNVSVSALTYRLNQLNILSEWHFKSLNIEMGRLGYKTTEPQTSPHEQSKVFEIVLGRCRELNMPLSFIANQICIPESELRGLLLGLTKVSIEGLSTTANLANANSYLRIIK